MALEPDSSVDEFPPEHTEAIEGLLWLGHLETEIEVFGHHFVLKTLTGDEELIVALLAKEYIDSYGQVKANIWAHLAASIQAVDGETDYCPSIGPGKQVELRGKMNFITKWYWPVAERLFDEYSLLVQRQAIALQAVEDLSSRSLGNSWPSPDFLADRGVSPETSTEPSNES